MKTIFKTVTRGTRSVVKQKRFFWVKHIRLLAFMVRLRGNMYLTIFHLNWRPFGLFLFTRAKEGEQYRGFFGFQFKGFWDTDRFGYSRYWLQGLLFNRNFMFSRREKTILRYEQKRVTSVYGPTARVRMTEDKQVIIELSETGIKLKEGTDENNYV